MGFLGIGMTLGRCVCSRYVPGLVRRDDVVKWRSLNIANFSGDYEMFFCRSVDIENLKILQEVFRCHENYCMIRFDENAPMKDIV